jgi:UDP-3-O-[3-hydroxymyristoyl] glucosamine N-acyltransferase
MRDMFDSVNMAGTVVIGEGADAKAAASVTRTISSASSRSKIPFLQFQKSYKYVTLSSEKIDNFSNSPFLRYLL